MDHSLYGYLQRQPTEILQQLLATYEAEPPFEPLQDIPEMIQKILLDRQNNSSHQPGSSPQTKKRREDS